MPQNLHKTKPHKPVYGLISEHKVLLSLLFANMGLVSCNQEKQTNVLHKMNRLNKK